jgi:Fic family protein
LLRAIQSSEELLQKVLIKSRFWKVNNARYFNERQRKVIGRVLEGFQGKLTSSKWASLAKCSQDTALRDINDLLEQKILVKEESGGRSTSYIVKSSE